MQESLYQRVDVGDTLSDSGCKKLSIRQRMQETLLSTADAGDTLSDSGCRSLSITQRMQESLNQKQMQETLYQMQPLSDRVSSASAR